MEVEAEFTDKGLKVFDEEKAEEIHEELYYGKILEDGTLQLSPCEALHLMERDTDFIVEGEELGFEHAYRRFCEIDDEFEYKYPAYSDLRERGYIVKSGFKFGAHFRVYPRGVNPYKQGDKREREHTKYVVHAVPENHTLSFQEMSRAVRLANNIRASMLWAVNDTEDQVTYYEVNFKKL
ncbi:MAG: tRNA-intron lyase [Candidatus Nanohalobium sp.]